MSATNKHSDDTLLRAAGKEDTAAFAQLVARHRPAICQLIHAIVQDRDQAEDLTQETFCRVYRHLSDYSARDQFVPYLKRIAINLARNFLRDRLRHQRQTEAAAQHVLLEQAGRDRQSDPAILLNSRLLQSEMRTAIESLRPDLQQTLLLYYFSGWTIPEIAATVGAPEGTIKSRLFHARLQLRHHLRES